MPMFQDQSGMAVKFFIQKDISQDIQADLCETITSLGGRVEAKVPRQGYILVQPGTAEEERLRLCWTSGDRPERYFVPYSYVEACKMAGMLLKQIFLEDGVPISMHIHPSIANVNARNALSSRIMHSGGNPHASVQSAKVILADPNTEVFDHLVKTYQGMSDKYIESYLWVKKCIEKGGVVYTPLVYKNPGGRRAGEERTQFTEDDERRLCTWIAAKIPYKETGGRTGNRLYQQLCDLAGDPEYTWVSRHTWQSWRERYKKNSLRLDNIIAQIVEQKKPALGEKGQYGYVRQDEEKPKRPRRKRVKTESSLSQIAGEYSNSNVVHPISMMPLTSEADHMQHPMNPTTLLPADQFSQDGSSLQIGQGSQPYSSLLTLAGSSLQAGTAVRKSPAEDEQDDDDPEWRIRIGNNPPPSWAKRKAESESEHSPERGPKRIRLNRPLNKTLALSVSGETTLSEDAVVQIASMHVIDQGIHQIAKEFRFTVEEVQEYYDKCGEMTITRARFQKMRQALEALGADV